MFVKALDGVQHTSAGKVRYPREVAEDMSKLMRGAIIFPPIGVIRHDRILRVDIKAQFKKAERPFAIGVVCDI